MANYSSGGLGSIPPVIKNLLIANILVFIAQLIYSRQGIDLEIWGALWSLDSGNFRVWQLITHMFMHGGFTHILFNMFTLWMFGSILENFWGSKRFLQFYMICGLASGLAQLFLQHDFYAVGASGAIMGVMAAFAYLFPNTQLYIMFIPIPIKAKYVIPGFMALDLFGSFAKVDGDNIAHWAHLGGAVAGLVIVIFWNKTRKKDFY